MDALINTATFYQKLMGPLLAEMSLPLNVLFILVGLFLLASGQKLSRISFVINGIILGAIIGYVIGSRFGMDPWLSLGLPAILLGAAGGFLKNTFTAITCGMGCIVPLIFGIMNWDNTLNLGQLYLAAIIVAVIIGAVSFAKCQHLLMVATAFEGAMLIFIAVLSFIHGEGHTASPTYDSMYQAYAFLPLILFFVVGLGGLIFQFVTESATNERE